MGRRSSIEQLDAAVKAEIDRLIREGGHTLDQILAHLRTMPGGEEVRRTALGDYRRKMEERLTQLREAQAVAGVWTAQLGEQPDSPMGQLLAELLKTVAFRTLADMQGSEAGIEPESIMLLAKALKDLSGAQKTDLEFRQKMRALWEAEIKAKAEQAAESVAKATRAAGLTPEAAESIRQMVLGVVG